jgi:hypothetical protein
MLTIIASGLSIAGLTLIARKLSVSFRAVLHLSEDLDPLRPQVRSDFESERQVPMSAAREESIWRLSGVLGGSNSNATSARSELPVASGNAEPRR